MTSNPNSIYINTPFIIQTVTKADYEELIAAGKELEARGKTQLAAKFQFRKGDVFQTVNGYNVPLYKGVYWSWNFGDANNGTVVLVIYEGEIA